MKVQKVNNNKAIITLTPDELAIRKVSVKDLKEGKEKAKNFFFEILEESEISDEFQIDSSQLLIEVSQTIDELFAITITKADCIPEEPLISKMKNIRNISYTVSSNIFRFDDIKSLYLFAIKSLNEDLFIGNNSLYIIDNVYYIHFSNLTIKNSSFVKTFSILSEYCSKYYSKKGISFFEYATLILKNNAIQTLQKI